MAEALKTFALLVVPLASFVGGLVVLSRWVTGNGAQVDAAPEGTGDREEVLDGRNTEERGRSRMDTQEHERGHPALQEWRFLE
ncbi:hypothetical protein GCM10022245_46720 [Streptomyces mayteni]